MKRKVVSLILSAAMIMSFGMTAMAEENAAAVSAGIVETSKTEGVTDTAYGQVRGFIDEGIYTFRMRRQNDSVCRKLRMHGKESLTVLFTALRLRSL